MAHGTVATKVHGHSHRLSAGITQASQSSASWMPGGKASTLPSYLPLFPIYFGFSLSASAVSISLTLSPVFFFDLPANAWPFTSLTFSKRRRNYFSRVRFSDSEGPFWGKRPSFHSPCRLTFVIQSSLNHHPMSRNLRHRAGRNHHACQETLKAAKDAAQDDEIEVYLHQLS
jgi:hypothetical protein